METTTDPELDLGPDHHFAMVLLVAVLSAALVAVAALGVLAAAQTV